MATASYLVTCDLGTERFDDPRVGVAAADAAYREVRRLGRLDQRVRSTGRRRRGATVRISVRLTAPTPWEAFDLGRAIVRTAVHATGGATHGWESLVPTVGRSRGGGRRLGRRSETVLVAPPLPTGWAAVSAAAQRRIDGAGDLPPLQWPGTRDDVVDLRHR